MSGTGRGGPTPRAVVQKQILESATEQPDASMEELADTITAALDIPSPFFDARFVVEDRRITFEKDHPLRVASVVFLDRYGGTRIPPDISDPLPSGRELDDAVFVMIPQRCNEGAPLDRSGELRDQRPAGDQLFDIEWNRGHGGTSHIRIRRLGD